MRRSKTSFVAGLLSWLIVTASVMSVRGAIPASAISDPRYALGYLVVTNYAGVDPTGVNDSTVGIQTALNDAPDNKLVVFFPPGTYTITNTLRCYNYMFWKFDPNDPPTYGGPGTPDNDSGKIAGSTLGPGRPVIKLKANASAFGDTNNIRPMIAYRNWIAVNTNGTVATLPSNPFLTSFGNFKADPPDLFDSMLRNIDFDCNGNPGAVGVSFSGAQNCSMDNVRIAATGAYAGFYGTPAGVGGVGNLEVEGGRYGLVMGRALGSDPADAGSTDVATFPGLRLVNQTVCALVADNYSGPVQAVGFYIKPAAGASVVQNRVNSNGGVTSIGTFGLFDGTIDMTNNSGAVAITNADAKSINIRNVYVTGTDNLTKNGNLATVTGTGTWKLISEYAYTDQRTPSGDPPYETSDVAFRTFSIINGTTSRTPVEPVKVIQNSASAPPADLLSRHIWSRLPSFEDGAITSVQYGLGTFVNPITYGATPDFFTTNNLGPNDTAAFQSAIDAASAAGHGRVVVPRGFFYITNTLTLRSNTILIGAGSRVSNIKVHDSWRPTTGSPIMIQTVDDANATTFMGWVSIEGRTRGGVQQPDGTRPYDRFSHVLWRAGRNSMTAAWTAEIEYVYPPSTAHPRTIMTFSGNGGGRHYGFSGPGRRMDGTGTRCLVFNGTTEPLWMYTCNVESTKGGPGPNADMNICITNAANIRLIGMKREGNSPTVLIYNSTNIALYGHEDRFEMETNDYAGDIQILGASTNILIAGALARGVPENHPVEGGYVLHEAIAGLPVVNYLYPESISIYQRGALNEAAVYIDGDSVPVGPVAPAAPSGLAATVISSNQVNLTWSDNALDEDQFRIERKINNGAYGLLVIKGSNSVAHGDTTVTAGNIYTYRVRAENTNGNSAWSNEAIAATTETNLVGRWPLEEGGGLTTADMSGNGNDGMLGASPNTPAWTAGGKIGGALKFDGVNDEVNVGHGPSLSLTGSATWAAWIYLSNTVTSARDIVSKRGGSGARCWSFYVEQNSVRLQVCDGANQNNNVIRTNATLLQTNQWYHVAGVYNASAQTLEVYVNGGLDNGGLVFSGLAAVPSTQFDAAANDVYLGRKSAASEYWNGMLDEVRVYARALTGPEIATLAVVPALQFGTPTVNGGQIQIGWTGTGQLEMAPAVTGPWTAILPAPSSPFATNVVSGENRFFRLKSP